MIGRPTVVFRLPARGPLCVVPLLRRADLAVHAIEGSARSNEHSGDGEQAVGAKSVIQPLAGEQEDDDRQRELHPDAGEIGAGETRLGAPLRPFFVIHFALKLTACEEFHKQLTYSFPKGARRLVRRASRSVMRS
jgi:hypothetical protein